MQTNFIKWSYFFEPLQTLTTHFFLYFVCQWHVYANTLKWENEWHISSEMKMSKFFPQNVCIVCTYCFLNDKYIMQMWVYLCTTWLPVAWNLAISSGNSVVFCLFSFLFREQFHSFSIYLILMVEFLLYHHNPVYIFDNNVDNDETVAMVKPPNKLEK